MATILIVEDERLLGESLRASLEDEGYQAYWVSSGEDAVDWLKDHQADLALLDCRLPSMSGLELLEEVSASHPDIVTVMMTANADVQMAIRAMRGGASDFLIKPVDLGALSEVARKNLHHRRMTQTLKHEQKTRTQEFGLHQIVGACAEIEKAKAMVRRLATLHVGETDRPPNVLITGETGTGKDVFARAIHFEGRRREGPFIHVNCAALPETLVESELFGHVKGAFTDARASKRGLFEVADHGTLFLDEIGALPLGSQSKVLTAIETGAIRPVGAAEEIRVNTHLVAAMNQNPADWVGQGRFRQDLYHRLRVVHLDLPPLRDRGTDLMTLAEHFARVYCRKFSMPVKKISRAAREAMRRYGWPGNVRELSHCIESAVLLSGDMLDAEFVPESRAGGRPIDAGKSEGAIPVDFSRGPIPLERVERELITRAMEATDNNVSRAAMLLDLSRDTMRYRLEKYGFNGKHNGTTT